MFHGEFAIFKSIGTKLEDICYKMYCWDPVLPNVCSTKSPAALGTSCGPQKVRKLQHANISVICTLPYTPGVYIFFLFLL